VPGAVARRPAVCDRPGPHIATEVRWARCLRSHGVPSFPDPNSQGAFDSSSSTTARPHFKPPAKPASRRKQPQERWPLCPGSPNVSTDTGKRHWTQAATGRCLILKHRQQRPLADRQGTDRGNPIELLSERSRAALASRTTRPRGTCVPRGAGHSPPPGRCLSREKSRARTRSTKRAA
jgi:hypothetical protein